MKKVKGGPTSLSVPDVLLVEGRLSGRRAAGVLVLRSRPHHEEAIAEKAATDLAALLAPNGGATDATCTLPELVRSKPILLEWLDAGP
jgi:hypothetical protein